MGAKECHQSMQTQINCVVVELFVYNAGEPFVPHINLTFHFSIALLHNGYQRIRVSVRRYELLYADTIYCPPGRVILALMGCGYDLLYAWTSYSGLKVGRLLRLDDLLYAWTSYSGLNGLWVRFIVRLDELFQP